MYNPEATIRILSKSLLCIRQGGIYYGAIGMERRIKRCCSDNPECKLGDKCDELHTKFVNVTDNPKEPSGGKYERPRSSVMETYKLHGLKQLTHADILRY